MEKVIKDFINENFETYFEAFIVPYMRKNYKTLFPELEKIFVLSIIMLFIKQISLKMI